MPRRIRPSRYLLYAGLLAAPSGCAPPEGERLVIATTWTATERRRVDSEFSGWLRGDGGPPPRGPIRLEWLVLEDGDDLSRLASRRRPPDVALGGPARAFDRLARDGRLVPLPMDGSPAWAVTRRGAIRLIAASGRPIDSGPPSGRRALAVDDPRRAPLSLAWAEGQLRPGEFVEGYARLVRAVGGCRRIGRLSGSASAAVGGGEAECAPGPAWDGEDAAYGPPWIEGVAILAGGPHRETAGRFVRFLRETGRAEATSPRSTSGAPDDAGLLADLLGATLVDAHDELRAAWSAMEAAGSPRNPLRWMTEPPPWPPASIARLQRDQGERAMAMVETLAGQIAPAPDVRSWLVRSWLSPTRPIDRAVLDELARAVDGRLVREPRFREWVRAEWTAWARQRYRRVLRAVAGGRGDSVPRESADGQRPTANGH